MTQHQLIIEWVKNHKFIDPAHKGGLIYMGVMFGSETTKRCRELEEKGILEGYREGRFVNYRFPSPTMPLNASESHETAKKVNISALSEYELKKFKRKTPEKRTKLEKQLSKLL